MENQNFEFIETKDVTSEDEKLQQSLISSCEPLENKCGEIYMVHCKDFLLTCTACKTIFWSLKGFSNHYLRNHHNNGDIKMEDNDQEDCELNEDLTELYSAGERDHSNVKEEINDTNVEPKSKVKKRLAKQDRSNNICEICNKQCPNQSYLLRHIASHTANTERPYKCQHCPKGFNYRNHLKRHEALHLKKPVFECDYCYTKFSLIDRKKAHESQHTDEEKKLVLQHGKKLAALNNQTKTTKSVDSSVPDGYWRCNICEKLLKNTYKEEDHLRLHTGEKPYVCDICGKRMMSRTLLNHHILVHKQDRRYKCTKCPSGFFSSAHLRRHDLSVHSIEKPYKCDKCGAGFGRKEHLTSHLSTHEKNRVKNFKCNICENSYYDANALRIHKKKHTSNVDGPFMCSSCPAAFQTKFALKRHQKRHVNKGLYKCDFCEKRFNDKDDKNQHEKRCHLTEREDSHQKLIACDQCDMKFMKKIDFTQHCNDCHQQGNIYNVQICQEGQSEYQDF